MKGADAASPTFFFMPFLGTCIIQLLCTARNVIFSSSSTWHVSL
jgi:hypothetical protein